jgi:hypothetical protein
MFLSTYKVNFMRSVISKFESVADFARKLDVPYQRASKWYQRDSIPSRYWIKVVALCGTENIHVTYKELASHQVFKNG